MSNKRRSCSGVVKEAAKWLPLLFGGFIVIAQAHAQTSGVAPLLSGDCSVSSAGVMNCTSTNGVGFAASATSDTTNAGNISSGTLNAARTPAYSGDATKAAGSSTTTVTSFHGGTAFGTAAGLSAGTGAGQVVVNSTANTIAQNTTGNAATASSVAVSGLPSFAPAYSSTGPGSLTFPQVTYDAAGRITSIVGVIHPSWTGAVFGDSYDYGSGASVLRNGYAALMKKDTPTMAGWLGNFGVPSTTMPAIAASVLANATPNNAYPSTWYIAGGENDYTACSTGTSACQNLFMRSMMAAVYWGAVSPQLRTLGSNMTKSGGWSNNTTLAPVNALTGSVAGSATQSTASGDTITLSIPPSNNGSARLFVYAPAGTTGATFTLTNTTTSTNYTDVCNGGSTTWNAFACNGTGAWVAGPWAIRLATQAGVANTLTLTHTNAAALTVIAYDYTTATPPANTNAVIFRNAGAAFDVSGWTATAAATVIAQARADGLNSVMLSDARSALSALPDAGVSQTSTATYAGSSQVNHPRDGGHIAMEQAALQAQVANNYVVSVVDAGVADPENFVDTRALKWSTPYGCAGTWATCYRNLNSTDDYTTSGSVFYGVGGNGVLGWHIDGAPQGVAATGSFLGAYLGFFSKTSGYCFDTPSALGNTLASNFTSTWCVRPSDGASVQSGAHTASTFAATASSGAGFHGVLFTPATSSAACNAGDFADDANYRYVCTATNTWKRSALSTF